MILSRMTRANAAESYPPILEGFVALRALEHPFGEPQRPAGGWLTPEHSDRGMPAEPEIRATVRS